MNDPRNPAPDPGPRISMFWVVVAVVVIVAAILWYVLT